MAKQPNSNDNSEDLGAGIPGRVDYYKQLSQLLTNIAQQEKRNVDLTAQEVKYQQELLSTCQSKLKLEGNLLENEQDQIKAAKEYLKVQKQIADSLSSTLKINTTLLDGLNNLAKNKLGSQLVGDMSSVNKKMTESLQAGNSGLKSLGSGAKEFGKEMTNSVNVTNLIIEGWKKVYSLYQDLDKVAVDFARNTNMTREQAWNIKTAYDYTTRSSKGLADTGKNWLETTSKINQQLGTGATLTEQTLKDYSELAKVAKYDEQTMQSLVISSALNSKTIKQSASDRLSGIKQGQMLYGIEVNQRQVMADMAKISATTRLNYMGQEQALAKATVQAKAMGLEFSKLEGIANSLMDFEGSITKQMEAEVLTGRTLNLERARYYALTNDVSGLMSEMNAQGITAEKFAGMNRIQQEAIAGAMGMQKDEMASMFIEQKAIAAYGAKDMEAAKQAYLLDVQKNGLAVANKKLGDDSLATQLQQITNEERRELSQDKMVNAMTELVSIARKFDNVLTKIVEAFSKMGDFIGALGRGFAYISGMRLVQWLMGDSFGKTAQSAANLITKASGGIPAQTMSTAGSSAGAGMTSKVLANAGQNVVSAGGKPLAGAAAASALNSAGVGTIETAGTGIAGMAKSFFASKAGKILGKVLKFPVIGTAIEGIFANGDINDMVASGKRGAELDQMVGKRFYQALGSIGGGALGAGLAVALSATGAPTFLASSLAATAGSIGGSWLAGILADSLGATGAGKMITNYKLDGKEPELAEGGIVTQTGIAKVDAGEVYLGANSLQILKDLVTETRQQNQYLQALVKKDTHISMDGQAVAGVVARNVITSYGNLLNPSSATYA